MMAGWCPRVVPSYLSSRIVRGTQIGWNAKFLLILIYKNDFWEQRVAKDEESRVLINPTALHGACEIDKTEKFLQPLISRTPCR